jgi:eukaryotic-like serine/threonine-protein kinase
MSSGRLTHTATSSIVWAPSGDWLYFVSDRDGSRCIWAQRLDPSTKKPVGYPVAIYHFHHARGEMTSLPATWLNLSAARDKLVFNLNELSGNVWLREEK